MRLFLLGAMLVFVENTQRCETMINNCLSHVVLFIPLLPSTSLAGLLVCLQVQRDSHLLNHLRPPEIDASLSL